jgi:hypothetical protein
MALWRTIAEATLALRAHTDRHRAAIAEEVLRGRRTEGDAEPAAAPQPPSLLQAMLDERSDEATLSFLVLPRETIAMLTWRPGVRAEVVPITRLDLRLRVATWHAAQASASSRERGLMIGTGDATGANRKSQVATNTLLADLGLDALLAELPERVKTLRIVPDDALHGVPWAALRLHERFLVQRFALIIGHGSEPLRARGRLRFDAKRALLVGVAAQSGDFQALAAVPLELDRVQQALDARRAQITRLDDASSPRPGRQVLLAALPTVQWWHAACHGIFVADRPDQSGLVLVPAPGQPHEVLSVRDLAGFDLSGLQHAVLSSCWSADSFVAPGRWIVSLPETLWRAGVRVVLASLWPVKDELGPAFLERYYGYLDTSTPPQALQRVQCDCIEGRLTLDPGSRPASALKLWAGFQIHA